MDKIFYTIGYKYRVAKTFEVELVDCPFLFIEKYEKISMPFAYIEKREDNRCFLICEEYYGWDGATWALDSKNFRRGSAAHDALLEMIGLGLLPADPWKPWADKFLIKLCKEDKMWALRRSYVYRAVTRLGNPKGSKPRKIYEAP